MNQSNGYSNPYFHSRSSPYPDLAPISPHGNSSTWNDSNQAFPPFYDADDSIASHDRTLFQGTTARARANGRALSEEDEFNSDNDSLEEAGEEQQNDSDSMSEPEENKNEE